MIAGRQIVGYALEDAGITSTTASAPHRSRLERTRRHLRQHQTRGECQKKNKILLRASKMAERLFGPILIRMTPEVLHGSG
jgi:hypothetical protein